jgi:Protein of unknown function (DUF3999)
MHRSFLPGVCVAMMAASALAGAPIAEWQYLQDVTVPAPGLTKLNLPPATLDAAQPNLADLRLLDPVGREVPFLVEKPRPPQRLTKAAASVQTSLEEQRTVVAIETGLDGLVDGLEVRTAADAFIKAVHIDGSTDHVAWQSLVQNYPLFDRLRADRRTPIALPPGRWRWLRVTIDDRRAEAIPILGVTVFGREDDAAPPESQPLRLVARDETPGATRFTVMLPARHLHLASLELAAADALFNRNVRVVYRQFVEDTVREEPLAQGTISRAAATEAPARENLGVVVEQAAPSRELVVIVENGDSPPLAIGGIQAKCRPVRVVFHAAEPGRYVLASGNRRATAPRYDLASFANDLRSRAPSSLQIGPLMPNPDFHPAEPLPEIPAEGAPLDVTPWAFRKEVQPAVAGVQQLELDAETVAHARRDFADLRLMRGDRQIPYVIESTALSRPSTPKIEALPDSRHPKVSRWKMTLPYAGLPVSRLTATATTPLFQRDLLLYEEVSDNRGNESRRWLGSASWTQRPESRERLFTLIFQMPPESDTLLLETDNGDNPPLELGNVELYYPVTRLLCKTTDLQPFALYYGNPQTSPPRYDLSLIGGQLLAADKSVPVLGAEETLKGNSLTRVIALAGRGGVVFWVGLAAVVAVLLVVIARLLPKPSAPPGK